MPEPTPTVFDSLIPELRKAIADAGYTQPTPIQAAAIPPLLKGEDLLGCAQTGTGKTAAFALPILQRLAKEDVARSLQRRHPRALILAPTRELAAQIDENIMTYGKYLRLPHAVVFGGVGIEPQIDKLARGVAILTATPGRLRDLVNRKALFLDHVDTVVLDEADRMLDMGFLPEIKAIIAMLPHKRQSLFFSATLVPEISRLARSFLTAPRPVEVAIEPEKPTVERIRQQVFFVDQEHKLGLLKELLNRPEFSKVILFSRMRHLANRLERTLRHEGFATAAIHGDKSQGARTNALNAFKAGKVKVLVATDIAARGIDVDDVTHVINFDLPDEPETYVHRIGRTARAGAGGEAISIVCGHDRNALRDIEKFIAMQVPWDKTHPLHSEKARTAMGAEATFQRKQRAPRPPRAQRPPQQKQKPRDNSKKR